MLISVVIPVYNGEKFIRRSVESVLPQMEADVELVLVDDGSEDKSGSICDEYAAKYDHIHVIHKPNGGISSARNAGIRAAKGEYLVFLDADDYLDPETCAQVANVIRTHRPDMIDFGWKYINCDGEATANRHGLPKDTLLGLDVIRNEILPPLLNLRDDPQHFIFDFSCTKVFRADLIRGNQIAFDENRRVWEDRPFVVHYLKYCRNFYAMSGCFYNYVNEPGSLSRKYSMDFFRIIQENYLLYSSLYDGEYTFDTPYVNGYWSHSVENMIFRSLEQKENREQIKQIICETLQKRQVVHWFSHRVPADPFEKKVSVLIMTGRSEDALWIYEKYAHIKRSKNMVNDMVLHMKHKISRRIRRT